MSLFRTVTVVLAILSPASRLFPGIIRNAIFIPNRFERKFDFLEKITKKYVRNEYEKVDYSHPESYGFTGGTNMYLRTIDGVHLGVWHLLPFSAHEAAKEMSPAVKMFSSLKWLRDATVFLYVHGSGGTRVEGSRMTAYRVLTDMNFHVFTFDYRGYGDSTSRPRGETDFVIDTITVYNWIRRFTKNIYLWGHSLGTGVAAHAAHRLANQGYEVKGLVLEGAFNSMADAVRNHPVVKDSRRLPWFEFTVIRPLRTHDMSFNTELHLKAIRSPVLLLHAKDDDIIPYMLAVRLYYTVRASRLDKTSVKMILFKGERGYNHCSITDDPYIDKIVGNFVERTKPKGEETKVSRFLSKDKSPST